MEEKTMYEMRVIETEDGYRVEMTGDKEKLRQMFFERGKMPFGCSPGHKKHFGFRGHFGRHRRGFGRHEKRGYDLGPLWDEEPPFDEEQPIEL